MITIFEETDVLVLRLLHDDCQVKNDGIMAGQVDINAGQVDLDAR